MKKLLVLAMILVLAAPLFAEMTIGGEFDYYMVNGFDSDGGDNGNSFVDNWDKGEVDFKGTIGDYSQIRIELEEDGTWNGSAGTRGEGTPSFNYFRVITDWGKFFGLDGIGIKTDIGLDGFATFDAVDFTGYNYENADSSRFMDNPELRKDFGFKLSLSFVDGLVQPYYAMSFDTVNEAPAADGEATFLVGSGFDFASMGLPLWFEAYYMKGQVEDSNVFGVEAMYDLAIGDMNFKIGGFFENATEAYIGAGNGDADDRGSIWGFGVGFEAFGAAINVSGSGYFGEDVFGENSAFSVMGIDAEYFFLDWLGVNAGASFAFGDYKETVAGDKAFQSFEAGIIAKPDKGVCYKLGYIFAEEDAVAGGTLNTRTLNTKRLAGEKGGLYFVTKIDF
ncbi:MAG: hypothetical protein IJQ86_09060 [Spirochaetia bacterium]|nr:hypothetical protein [Spirochaetia bacterium]